MSLSINNTQHNNKKRDTQHKRDTQRDDSQHYETWQWVSFMLNFIVIQGVLILTVIILSVIMQTAMAHLNLTQKGFQSHKIYLNFNPTPMLSSSLWLQKLFCYVSFVWKFKPFFSFFRIKIISFCWISYFTHNKPFQAHRHG